MRPLVATVVLAAAATGRADAMGADRTAELVAWNRDGLAALIEQRSMLHGSHTRGYVLLAIGEKPVIARVTETVPDDAAVEQVTLAACLDSVKYLAAMVADHRFNGVAVRAKNCERAGRDVVAIDAGTARDVKRSWIALTGRAATAREKTGRAIVATIAPDYQPPPADDDCTTGPREIDVANKSGKLVLVFSANRCVAPNCCVLPVRTEVRGFARRGDAYVDAHIYGD